jgi:predicted transcriptional regulator
MNASKMLARLERATKEKGVTVTEFLMQYGLPASTFYVIKKTKEIKPKMHKRYLEALRDFEPALADAVEVEVQTNDVVNSPQHYKRDGIECIDAMVQVYGLKRVQEYAEISAFKYQWREGLKGDSKTDKLKKIWYTRFSMGDDPRRVSDV